MTRRGARTLALCALVLGSTGACARRYAHGRIPVDRETRRTWDAGEKEAEKAGMDISAISVDKNNPDVIPASALKKELARIFPSKRHGADDKRLLSDPKKPNLSSNIVARIVLVKGSEYKSEREFENGWIPVAIIYRSLAEKFSSDVYDELQLQHVETSWVFVRKLSDATWKGKIVSRDGRGFMQSELKVTTGPWLSPNSEKPDSVKVDELEPVIGARFVWDDKDESIWAYCGGKCCQMRR